MSDSNPKTDREPGSGNPDQREARSVVEGDDFRAGAGGAADESAGMPGGTLGTGGRREQDQ